MAEVSVVRHSGYDAGVNASVAEAVGLLGGMSAFVRPGQRILIKPNLLAKAAPGQAVTTHPAVVEAVIELVLAAGGRPLIADSPGGPFFRGALAAVYRTCGLAEVAERTGAELNYDTSSVTVNHPGGHMLKRLDLIKVVRDVDAVITLPKLKTHLLTTFTGATKILFGVVPGLTKVNYHSRLDDLDQFSEMLIDILDVVKPVLHIMDGIVGMEGAGPRHGRPRPVGVLIAGANAAAVDAAACALIGCAPSLVQPLMAAVRRGYWDGRMESIRILGLPLADATLTDFHLPVTAGRRFFGNMPWLRPFIRKNFNPRPAPRADLCTGCGTCLENCPGKAITIRGKKAVVDEKLCLRCYCCHELCPSAAVALAFPPLGRLLGGLGG